MPHVIRSRDHSIWFKHIADPSGELLAILRGLEPRQAVVLLLGGREGLWRRFGRANSGSQPEALACADDRAVAIWNALPEGSTPVEITIVRIEGIVPRLPAKESNARTRKCRPQPTFTPAAERLDGDVVCIGIDIAWWGGQAGRNKRGSRSECLAVAARTGGEWRDMTMRRVDLTQRDNPTADEFTANADEDADLLVEAVLEVMARFPSMPRIVVAGDVPMLATLRSGLPRPQKNNERSKDGGDKVADYRACDRQWQVERAKSPRGWSNVQILPGAPLYPRVEKFVGKLRALGFEMYQHPWKAHPRLTLLECFPNEVLWSAGVLGYAEKLTESSIRAYKRIGKARVRLPSDVFTDLCRHTLFPAFRAARLNQAISEKWFEAFVGQLRHDDVITDDPAEGRSGKAFDDCVDSVLSLVAAVAFVDGIAHVHQGDDATDGHIIGSGLPTSTHNTSIIAAVPAP